MVAARLVPFLLLAGLNAAAAPAPTGQEVNRERIHGSELMTHAERDRYRARLRAMGDPAQQERFKADHRKAIDERRRKRHGNAAAGAVK